MFFKNKNKIPEPLKFEANLQGKRDAFPYPKRHC